MSKGKGKNVLLVVFFSLLGFLFLYWVCTYKPSGDFFRLDEAKIEIGVLDNARQCNSKCSG